ncbi:hypothetical protein PIB30_001829 [Stylosanthes scabra]|uniref:NB-ARC domain-containing protein n=1 Tax=Stylosanthes scabra TaxID=79078 RepID=A0ABU6W1K9_9FABA|nr:hypothetical protein [Stylosanthes scabra]
MNEGSSSWRRALPLPLPSRGQIKSTILRHLMRSQTEISEYGDMLEKSTIVGAIHRAKEENKIIEELLNKPGAESGVPPVVTITGVAGIGKTTLARIVCEDDKVKARFGSPIWLNAAGKIFDDLQSIAGSVRQKAAAGGNNNRSLLVLDDLRSEDWESKLSELRKELTKDGPSVGAIITTTRGTCGSSLVEKAMAMHHVLPLKGLDEEQSWSLLESLGSCNKEKEEEMREIVRKCKGVPVAIKIAWNLQEEEEAKLSELMPEPPELQLLAYVSLFPDGYLIHAHRLLHLWIAEGFGAEEYCRSVFDEFVKLGIFQDVKVKVKEENDDAVVKSCRVHPYMQELACFVAKKEDCIATAIDDSQVTLRASFDMRSADSVAKLDSFLKEDKRAKDVRTILFHAMVLESPLVEERMNEYTCDKLLSTCKALRVLDLQHLGMSTVPSSIGKLKDLTYLDLSYNNIDKLPSSITKLSQLTTLKLSQCHLLKELPKDLKDLTKLAHLHIDGCVNIHSMPRGISKLTSLQTLSQFVVGKNEPMASHEELKDLNQLKGHLEILYPERLKLQPSSSKWMNQKEHLRRLTFRCDQHDKGDKDYQESALQVLEPHPNLTVLHMVGYKGKEFPTWIPSLVSLVKLSLYNCATPKPLPPLDKLPCLKVLELRRMHSLEFIAEKYDDNVHEVFPSLKELTLWDCPKLQSWWGEKDKNNDGKAKNSVIFRCISSLRIQYCPKLTHMPLYPTLDEMLELVDSSVETMRSTIHYGKSETGSKEGKGPFSKLKRMFIASVDKSPPAKWLIKFTSLEELHIRDCFQLKALPSGFNHLSSLRTLTIENCPVLDLDQSSCEWEGLKNLNSLIIREIPMLKSLPLGLEKVKSLQEIKVHDCAGLTSLSEGIGRLTSLVRLEICRCEKLESLPEGVKHLISLVTLVIKDCPLLMPRCQPETGNDWPKIAHVKNILVKQTSQDMLGKLRM